MIHDIIQTSFYTQIDENSERSIFNSLFFIIELTLCVLCLLDWKYDGVLIYTRFTFDKYLFWNILLQGLDMNEITHI